MASFGLFGLGVGCTWAKAELLIISATHTAPAAIVKCPIHSSRGCAPVIPALLSSAPPDHPAHILTAVFAYGSGGSEVTITRESFAKASSKVLTSAAVNAKVVSQSEDREGARSRNSARPAWLCRRGGRLSDDFRCWHNSDIPARMPDVRFRG